MSFISKMIKSFALLLIVGAVFGHEINPGKCPDFNPMKSFDWEKFSSGVWYVTQKFDTKSTCLTYEFKTDNLGFKSIEQIRQLPFKDAVGIDHDYKYTGKLFVPQESVPSKMIVRFPLNAIGSASYVILDTDYDSYGLLCTCQAMDLFITTAHRISCSILQRTAQENEAVTEKMKALIPGLFSLVFTVVMINLVKIMKIFLWNQSLHLFCDSFIFLSCSLENRARDSVSCCNKQIHSLASTE